MTRTRDRSGRQAPAVVASTTFSAMTAVPSSGRSSRDDDGYDADDAYAGDAPANLVEGRWKWGWVFAAIWLVYLTGTLEDALNARHIVQQVVGVLALAAFGALYVWSFLVVRILRRTGQRIGWGMRLTVLGGAFALTVVEAFCAGESALAMGVFIVVMSLFSLPLPLALVVFAVVVASSAGLPYVVPGWAGDNGGLVLGTITAGLAMFGVLQLIQRNVQLTAAREEIAGLAVSQERGRFARDLHDLLGHSLTVITMKAELAGRLTHLDPDRAAAEIAEVERLARDALADVRATVAGYRTVSLPHELAAARVALDAAGIEADLPTAVDNVPTERRELLGWAVREGVTNVVRHSGARHCRIVVSGSAVEVVDDGRGPAEWGSPSPVAGGNGLSGLRERAADVGASVSVGAVEGGGFRLRVGW
jgi:two-component system sensor histidine kinase DesK